MVPVFRYFLNYDHTGFWSQQEALYRRDGARRQSLRPPF